ncbi:hypothetical protein MUP77_08910, partial [Candidatus Bathyarchaeota archaeon]|nr:hypothetical protein [Candidatus Bathyarchaeota archaeon]
MIIKCGKISRILRKTITPLPDAPKPVKQKKKKDKEISKPVRDEAYYELFSDTDEDEDEEPEAEP